MIEMKVSEGLAYWIGVAQSDGSIQLYRNKMKKNTSISINFQIGESSLPMLIKFKALSKKLFNLDAKIIRLKSRKAWQYRIGVKKLLKLLKELDIRIKDPPNPPKWIISNSKFFGAYLAGLIDGDGDVRVKRKKYPQCVIRISGNKKQTKLSKTIRKKLKCSTRITRRHSKRYSKKLKRTIEGRWFELEFVVSNKNYNFIKDCILPFIQLDYKKNKILCYINSKSY
jgi:hypothetical protein